MQFRPDIQGLRAIAVLAVIVFHLNPAWLPGGFVGVDIFLVISGFLISSILLHKKSKPGYSLTSTLGYFYTSRLKRIAPAYYATLVMVSLLAAVLFLPADFATYRDGLKKAETVFIAASWNWHMQSQAFNQALTNFLKKEALQAQKYIISQEPLLNRHPLRNQRFTHLGIGTKAGLDKDYLRTNQILQEFALATKQTTYLALDKLDIFKQAPIWNGHLIYYDEHHLNEVGAVEYAKQALPIILQEVINAN